MWRILREAFPEARFRRQVPLRHFIADFASHRARLVIECDLRAGEPVLLRNFVEDVVIELAINRPFG